MASTVLPNGIIIPEKYSRDWYNDLYHNWQELDNLLAGGGANDGTLTIQKNGDTVGTFSANQATNETVNITVPDVNNGTLTIQQNGTTVDTFTANSSTDKTVNIQCVDLNSNQTVGGNKEFTGTTTAHDVIPSATDTYNLGTSTNKWQSFNGINPGALSLPCDTYTDDHSNNLVYQDYQNGYNFETSYDCLITLRSQNYNGNYLIVNDTLNIRNSVSSGFSGVNLFARKGDHITVYCPAASINTGVLLRLFKLKGNE